MGEYGEADVAFDTSKTKHAAIADGGRRGEVRFLGEVASSPARVERLTRKLAERYDKRHFCYEAGPTGYRLYRHLRELGHDCTVVAPSLIPKTPGERIKTNRRDAVSLARLLRAGELTAVGGAGWPARGGARSGSRARGGRPGPSASASSCCRFFLRPGRIFDGRQHWTLAHRRRRAGQSFAHPAQQIVFQAAIEALDEALARLRRLEQQLVAIVPSRSMPVLGPAQPDPWGAGRRRLSGAARRLRSWSRSPSPPRSAISAASPRRGS